MAEPKLLRRPLSPKVERQPLTTKRKSQKAVHGEDVKSKEIPGKEIELSETEEKREVEHVPIPTPVKSHQIYLSFPEDVGALDLNKDRFLPSCDSTRFGPGQNLLWSTQLPFHRIARDVIIPPQPSGPPSFPLQKRRFPFRLQFPMYDHPLLLASDYVLEGFPTATTFNVPAPARTVPMISRCNYEVLTSELNDAQRRSQRRGVKTILFWNNDLPSVVPRKPKRQMQIEKRLEEKMRQFPILEEDTEEKLSISDYEQKKRKKKVTYTEPEPDDGLVLVSGVRCKSQPTLEDEEKQLASKAHMAVLCCHLHKKTGLSLKGYFLSRLPDLSLLENLLLYLNVSFNELHFFPKEVYNIENLEVLKLRNNPITFIPDDIDRMQNLQLLVMSFNLLTALPPALFMLPQLEGLDVSYNELEFIPNDIGKLRTLKYLNIEGNLLHVLPSGMLNLHLSRLKVENNFLHPLLWKLFPLPEPQRLADMAALCFAQHNLRQRYSEIPKDIQDTLSNCTICDCCLGPLYGQGLRFIRIYRNTFGVRLPYVFAACSPVCYTNTIAAPPST